ncbi:MAG TPA: histidine kinase, partial [Rudaea sp.]|nr:histidine kinase [Rudaea sp.]
MTDIPARRSRALFWIAYAAAWTALGVWEGTNVIIGHRNSGQPIAPWEPMTWELSSTALMAVLAVCVFWFERRFPLSGPHWLRRLPLHIPAAIAFSAVHTLGMVGIRKVVYAVEGRYYDFGDTWLGFAYELQKDLISYAVIVIACIALRMQRLRRERELAVVRLERDLSEARLAQLTAQIEPHFMFNTLNAISNRMHEDVEAADRMIAAFADLLRAALAESGSALVRVSDDVIWLERYFELMRERFRGKLETKITLDPAARAASIPRLLLQPLVENAFEHGLKSGRGRVEVAIVVEDQRLRCTIEDDAGQEPKCLGGQGWPGEAAGQEPKCDGQEPECPGGHGRPRGTLGGQGWPGEAAGQEPKCDGQE